MSIATCTGHIVKGALALLLVACAPGRLAQPNEPAAGVISGARSATFVDVRTEHVERNGVRYAYRRYGTETPIPLVLLQHFRGSMDNWDPALIDAFARERTVVLFDNDGVSGSSGVTPESFAAMAEGAAQFIGALGYERVDVLGFSIGGAVAQELAIAHPALVRKLILAGTAPLGGEGLNTRDPEIIAMATKPIFEYEDCLTLFFEPTEASQRAGRAYIERLRQRIQDLDVPSSAQTMRAQSKARNDWGATPDPGHSRLKRITQPVLIANGSHDIMMFTVNSVTMFQNLPNAQLILYPDSGHGFLFQYPELFATHVSAFLNG